MTGDPPREDERVQKLNDEGFLRMLFDLPALSEADEEERVQSDEGSEESEESQSEYRVDGELR
jgi:hypothetical protein